MNRRSDYSRRQRKCFVGAVVWGLVAIAVGALTADVLSKLGGPERLSSLANYWLGRDAVLHRTAPGRWVASGDGVFYRRGDGSWTQVGFVESVTLAERRPQTPGGDAGGNRTVNIRLRWHDREIDHRSCRLVAYQNRGTPAEMLQVMFPEAKRDAIQRLLADAMRQHGDSLAKHFMPLVEKSVRDSLPVVETEFLASLDRHRDQVSRLGDRWKEEILKDRLLPLAREQLLPIARRHAEPTLREIGRELWGRASLWSFTWRAAYDRTPLPRRDLMREEWERFIREEAIPVIEQHSDELALAIQKTLAEMMRSDAVRDELASAANILASDPETRELIGAILRETLIQNQAVRKVWVDVWTSDEARAAYEDTSELLGPLVHRIGEEILGSPQRGIDPGLARLLRHQVLAKDRRWIVAVELGDAASAEDRMRLFPGRGDPTYPVLHIAAPPNEP